MILVNNQLDAQFSVCIYFYSLHCEVREKTNKVQQLDVYYQHFLNMFGHQYAHLQEYKTCVTACGVLRCNKRGKCSY